MIDSITRTEIFKSLPKSMEIDGVAYGVVVEYRDRMQAQGRTVQSILNSTGVDILVTVAFKGDVRSQYSPNGWYVASDLVPQQEEVTPPPVTPIEGNTPDEPTGEETDPVTPITPPIVEGDSAFRTLGGVREVGLELNIYSGLKKKNPMADVIVGAYVNALYRWLVTGAPTGISVASFNTNDMSYLETSVFRVLVEMRINYWKTFVITVPIIRTVDCNVTVK